MNDKDKKIFKELNKDLCKFVGLEFDEDKVDRFLEIQDEINSSDEKANYE